MLGKLFWSYKWGENVNHSIIRLISWQVWGFWRFRYVTSVLFWPFCPNPTYPNLTSLLNELDNSGLSGLFYTLNELDNSAKWVSVSYIWVCLMIQLLDEFSWVWKFLVNHIQLNERRTIPDPLASYNWANNWFGILIEVQGFLLYYYLGHVVVRQG